MKFENTLIFVRLPTPIKADTKTKKIAFLEQF